MGKNWIIFPLATDCQGVRKLPLAIWLQTSGCKCYWLFMAGGSTELEQVPREVPGGVGVGRPLIMAPLVCQLRNEIPVSHLMTFLFQMGKLRLGEVSKITQERQKSPLPPLSSGHPVSFPETFNVLWVFPEIFQASKHSHRPFSNTAVFFFSLNNIIFKISPDKYT